MMKSFNSNNLVSLLVGLMTFTHSVIAYADTSWQWDFGDGSGSSDQNTSHVYSAAGDYSWKLTLATDDQQCVQTGQIKVSDPCVRPDITEDPSGQALPYAQSATLTVKATGTNLHYQWYEGSSSDLSNPLSSQSDTLTTPTLTKSTSFWVRVSNACGQINSLAAAVTVAPECQAPSVLEQPLGQTVLPKSKATLSVTATGTDLNYQWYEGVLGNTSKPVGSNYSIFTTPSLRAATKYWVIVSNGCGMKNSVEVKIQVSTVAPTILSVSPKTAPPGSRVVIRGRNLFAAKRLIKVFFGNLEGTLKNVASTRLIFLVPRKAQAGRVLVSVRVKGLRSNSFPLVVKR